MSVITTNLSTRVRKHLCAGIGNDVNAQIEISAERGPQGEECATYQLGVFVTDPLSVSSPSSPAETPRVEPAADSFPAAPPHLRTITLQFQEGTIEESGVNGLTNEALLAIVWDRIRTRQKDRSVSTREAACALTHVEEALMWLHEETRSRLVAN
jgi:hypothetical protein